MSKNDPLDWLATHISEPRLRQYLTRTGGDPVRAIELYTWNAHLAAAFFIDLGHLEVALRNALDSRMTVRHQRLGLQRTWLDDPAGELGRDLSPGHRATASHTPTSRVHVDGSERTASRSTTDRSSRRPRSVCGTNWSRRSGPTSGPISPARSRTAPTDAAKPSPTRSATYATCATGSGTTTGSGPCPARSATTNCSTSPATSTRTCAPGSQTPAPSPPCSQAHHSADPKRETDAASARDPARPS